MASRMRTYTPYLPKSTLLMKPLSSRKFDIENERLPPKHFNPESDDRSTIIQNSLPTTPANETASGTASHTSTEVGGCFVR
jgi:hypothetical protein